MKRSDILSRVIELVRQKRVNGKLDLLSDDYPDKSIERILFISEGKLHYCISENDSKGSWSQSIKDREIPKYKLAAFLYEIGTKKDRSSVVNDVTLQDYAHINNKLGALFKK